MARITWQNPGGVDFNTSALGHAIDAGRSASYGMELMRKALQEREQRVAQERANPFLAELRGHGGDLDKLRSMSPDILQRAIASGASMDQIFSDLDSERKLVSDLRTAGLAQEGQALENEWYVPKTEAEIRNKNALTGMYGANAASARSSSRRAQEEHDLEMLRKGLQWKAEQDVYQADQRVRGFDATSEAAREQFVLRNMNPGLSPEQQMLMREDLEQEYDEKYAPQVNKAYASAMGLTTADKERTAYGQGRALAAEKLLEAEAKIVAEKEKESAADRKDWEEGKGSWHADANGIIGFTPDNRIPDSRRIKNQQDVISMFHGSRTLSKALTGKKNPDEDDIKEVMKSGRGDSVKNLVTQMAKYFGDRRDLEKYLQNYIVNGELDSAKAWQDFQDMERDIEAYRKHRDEMNSSYYNMQNYR